MEGSSWESIRLQGACRSRDRWNGERFGSSLNYYTPLEYKAFQDDTHRRYLGVGVAVRMVDKGVLLTKVFPGGPAQKAGLKVGGLFWR